MVKYKLGIKDRLLLIPLIPEEGNFIDVSVGRDLRKKIGFPVKELDLIKLENKDDGRWTWTVPKETKEGEEPYVEEREFEIVEREKKLIQKVAKMLDEKEKMTVQMFEVLEKYDLIPESIKKKMEE